MGLTWPPSDLIPAVGLSFVTLVRFKSSAQDFFSQAYTAGGVHVERRH